MGHGNRRQHARLGAEYDDSNAYELDAPAVRPEDVDPYGHTVEIDAMFAQNAGPPRDPLGSYLRFPVFREGEDWRPLETAQQRTEMRDRKTFGRSWDPQEKRYQEMLQREIRVRGHGGSKSKGGRKDRKLDFKDPAVNDGPERRSRNPDLSRFHVAGLSLEANAYFDAHPGRDTTILSQYAALAVRTGVRPQIGLETGKRRPYSVDRMIYDLTSGEIDVLRFVPGAAVRELEADASRQLATGSPIVDRRPSTATAA